MTMPILGLRKPPGRHTRLTPLLRLLILTQLAFNIGFYAVLPFLSEHLGRAIGTSTSAGPWSPDCC